MTLMMPPIAFPYSASKPLVWIAISWIESNVKLEVNVCVTGSVVFSPSIRKEDCPRLEPKTEGFPPAPVWFETPGASSTTFWYERRARPTVAYFRWSSLRFSWVFVWVGSITTVSAVTVTSSVTRVSDRTTPTLEAWSRLTTTPCLTRGSKEGSAYSTR